MAAIDDMNTAISTLSGFGTSINTAVSGISSQDQIPNDQIQALVDTLNGACQQANTLLQTINSVGT